MPATPTTSSQTAGPAASNEVSSDARRLLDQFAGAFESAATSVDQSVVPILSEQTVPAQMAFFSPFPGQQNSGPEDMLRRFFFAPPRRSQPEERLQSLGSGVIATADGYILTNNHVVENADRLTVITSDRKRHEAEVIGVDPETDLAVVKIDAESLVPATFGDSDGLRVGQWVIAVGNPLQMLHSVTAGIISATGRSAVGIADYEEFIQTDASINPGNSGGALADLDGRVIGINTAIASPTGGNVGVGFAIPINMARQVMDQLIDHGSISRGFLGVTIQDLDETLADTLGIGQARGALVGDVTSGSPADKAGIRRGDVIVSLDGHEVVDAAALRNDVAAIEPGTRVDVGVERDGHETRLTVQLGERPSSHETAGQAAAPESAQRRLGLSVQELTPELASHLGYEGARGALIAGAEAGSPAERAGLRRGDLIVEVNRTPVNSVGDLRRVLSEAEMDAAVLLLVRRGDSTFFVAIEPDRD
jgi:serine protease Do